MLGKYMEGTSVMLDKWKSVKRELREKLGVKSTANGWRLDVFEGCAIYAGIYYF